MSCICQCGRAIECGEKLCPICEADGICVIEKENQDTPASADG
jgi:hypothetical protein